MWSRPSFRRCGLSKVGAPPASRLGSARRVQRQIPISLSRPKIAGRISPRSTPLRADSGTRRRHPPRQRPRHGPRPICKPCCKTALRQEKTWRNPLARAGAPWRICNMRAGELRACYCARFGLGGAQQCNIEQLVLRGLRAPPQLGHVHPGKPRRPGRHGVRGDVPQP